MLLHIVLWLLIPTHARSRPPHDCRWAENAQVVWAGVEQQPAQGWRGATRSAGTCSQSLSVWAQHHPASARLALCQPGAQRHVHAAVCDSTRNLHTEWQGTVSCCLSLRHTLAHGSTQHVMGDWIGLASWALSISFMDYCQHACVLILT
jgi:hypothetical protein